MMSGMCLRPFALFIKLHLYFIITQTESSKLSSISHRTSIIFDDSIDGDDTWHSMPCPRPRALSCTYREQIITRPRRSLCEWVATPSAFLTKSTRADMVLPLPCIREENEVSYHFVTFTFPRVRGAAGRRGTHASIRRTDGHAG